MTSAAWRTITQVIGAGKVGALSVWPDATGGLGDEAQLRAVSVQNAPPEQVRLWVSSPHHAHSEFHLPPELHLNLDRYEVLATPASPITIEAVNLGGQDMQLVGLFQGALGLRTEYRERAVVNADDLRRAASIATIGGHIGELLNITGLGNAAYARAKSALAGDDFRQLPALGDGNQGLGYSISPAIASAWHVTIVGPSPVRLRLSHDREDSSASGAHRLFEQTGNTVATWPFEAASLYVYRSRQGSTPAQPVSSDETAVQVVAILSRRP